MPAGVKPGSDIQWPSSPQLRERGLQATRGCERSCRRTGIRHLLAEPSRLPGVDGDFGQLIRSAGEIQVMSFEVGRASSWGDYPSAHADQAPDPRSPHP